MVLITYLQGRNGDAGIENGLVDTVGEGEKMGKWKNETNGESSLDIHTLSFWDVESEVYV